jgi:hypothetical protein
MSDLKDKAEISDGVKLKLNAKSGAASTTLKDRAI